MFWPFCSTSPARSKTPENRPPTRKSPVFRRDALVRRGSVKTRIIQNEPEPEPAAETGGGRTGRRRARDLAASCLLPRRRRRLLHHRRHPPGRNRGRGRHHALHRDPPRPAVASSSCSPGARGSSSRTFPGRAAKVARVAIVPYAIAYSMFDAIAGVALGGIVRLANDASAADGAVVQRLDGYRHGLRRRRSSSVRRRTCPGSSWPLPLPLPSSRSAGEARRC